MRIDLDKCAKKISINNHEELSNLNLEKLMYPVLMYGEEKNKNSMFDDWNEYEHTMNMIDSLSNYSNLKFNIYYLQNNSLIVGICFVIYENEYMKKFINNINDYNEIKIYNSGQLTCFHILKEYRGIGTKWLENIIFPDLLKCNINTIYIKSSHNKALTLYQKIGTKIGNYVGISDNKLYQRLGYIYKIDLNMYKK